MGSWIFAMANEINGLLGYFRKLEYLEVVGIPDSIGDPALEGKVRQVFREIINIKKENTASWYWSCCVGASIRNGNVC